MKRFLFLIAVLICCSCSSAPPRSFKLWSIYDVALPDSIGPSYFSRTKLPLARIGSDTTATKSQGFVLEVNTPDLAYPVLHLYYFAEQATEPQQYQTLLRQISWLKAELHRIVADPNAVLIWMGKNPHLMYEDPYFIINYGDSTFTLNQRVTIYHPVEVMD